MDKNANTELTRQLQDHWSSIEPKIIEHYSGVSTDDLRGFTDANDLIDRLTQKAGVSKTEVEPQLRQFASSASGS
jgi:hypothetical protein